MTVRLAITATKTLPNPIALTLMSAQPIMANMRVFCTVDATLTVTTVLVASHAHAKLDSQISPNLMDAGTKMNAQKGATIARQMLTAGTLLAALFVLAK